MFSSFFKSNSDTDSLGRTRVGGGRVGTDLERLLPDEPQAIETGGNDGSDVSDPGIPKMGTTSEVVTSTYTTPPDSSTLPAHSTTTNGPGQMLITSGEVREGRGGDVWARNLAGAGVVILVLSTWAIVLFNDPGAAGWFVYHPLLQTFALGCFTYGIMTLQPTSQPKTKAAGLIRHQTAVFMIGFPSITLGTLAVVYNKWLRDADHFKTWHGTLGLVCMLWLLVQIFLGAGSVWNDGELFGGGLKAKSIWKYHRASGYVLFSLMILTAHLGGGWSGWGQKKTDAFTRLVVYSVAPALILLGVYTRIRLSKMKFW